MQVPPRPQETPAKQVPSAQDLSSTNHPSQSSHQKSDTAKPFLHLDCPSELGFWVMVRRSPGARVTGDHEPPGAGAGTEPVSSVRAMHAHNS